MPEKGMEERRGRDMKIGKERSRHGRRERQEEWKEGTTEKVKIEERKG